MESRLPERRIPKRLGIRTTKFTIKTEDLVPDLTDDWSDTDLPIPIPDDNSVITKIIKRQEAEHRAYGQALLPIFTSAIQRALKSGDRSLHIINPAQRTESLTLSLDTSEENAADPLVEITWSLHTAVANIAITPILLFLASPVSDIVNQDLSAIGEAYVNHGSVNPDLESHLPTISRHLTHSFRNWPAIKK